MAVIETLGHGLSDPLAIFIPQSKNVQFCIVTSTNFFFLLSPNILFLILRTPDLVGLFLPILRKLLLPLIGCLTQWPLSEQLFIASLLLCV